MKKVSFFLLLILLTLLAEDFLHAHATAEDLSKASLEFSFDHSSNHAPSSPCENPEQNHRGASHFGHCSFLLIENSFLQTFSQPLKIQNFYYFFSLKLANTGTLLRPPIAAL